MKMIVSYRSRAICTQNFIIFEKNADLCIHLNKEGTRGGGLSKLTQWCEEKELDLIFIFSVTACIFSMFCCWIILKLQLDFPGFIVSGVHETIPTNTAPCLGKCKCESSLNHPGNQSWLYCITRGNNTA